MADDYVNAVKLGSGLIEEHAVNQSPSRIEELAKIFIHATNVGSFSASLFLALLTLPQMETGFWDIGSLGE